MTITIEYTVEQKAAMEQLKKRFAGDMKPELYEDTHLFYRFLKARDFNLDLAESMLRKHLQWRKDFSLDTILTDYTPPEGLSKFFPGGLIGVDKDQCPVKYFAFGNLDPKGIRKAAKFSDIVKHVIQTTEREAVFLKKQSLKVGKELPGSVYIVDFKDLPFSTATDKKALEHTIYLAKMYQDNYPEMLKSAYVINISPYFTLVFNIVKVFLAASIMKKCHFCSRDDIKHKLLNVMDAHELPAFLGGNKTDPDGNPLCLTFVNHAGKVLPKYFANKRSISFSKVEGVQKLIVPRSSFSEIKVEVSEPGMIIEWEFEIKSKDIGFGLYFEDSSKEMVDIVSVQRIDTEEFSETGCHKCEKAGTYVLLFDNSYSWMRSKEVHYRVVMSSSKTLGDISLD
ncbi:SEC14-like protein 3 [Trichonephila clavipes]|nr:SEC14-like protein 3 [Trichonephila clavipes]